MPLTPEELGVLEQHVEHYFTKRLSQIDFTLRRLQRALVRRWLIAIVGLLIAGAGIYYVNHQVAQNQRHNTTALCSLRDDVHHRITSTQTFIKQHPRGIPGISSSALKVSLIDAQHTYHALGSLVCPPPSLPFQP